MYFIVVRERDAVTRVSAEIGLRSLDQRSKKDLRRTTMPEAHMTIYDKM